MRWGRIARYALAFAVGGVVGGGVVFVRSTAPLLDVVFYNLALYESERAYSAYRYGSYRVARERILEYLEFVDGKDGRQGAGKLGKGTPADVALWYGRLAAAADRAGQRDEAARYLQVGIEKIRAGATVMSESQLRELVRLQDVSWDDDLRK